MRCALWTKVTSIYKNKGTPHRLGQNSILSRVKMMVISVIVCEKKQRLEVARGFTVFTSQFYRLHTIPTQPVNTPALE
eukprot:COSAG02_NODE_688_length_18473_cov_77.428105_6_plen_78_part_00